tara:strand:+ start:106 stop:399 length:294 start_codon:yes stop_codon:yes gene_type:complete
MDYYDTEAVVCENPQKGGVQALYWLRCYYDYTPGEREVTYYPDGSGYPGSSPELQIHKVTICYGSRESECMIHLLEEIHPRFDLESLEEKILQGLSE